jgi:hypothetical protein
MKMFKYWIVEEVYCFDTCISKKNHNFRTKKEAYEYYKENKDKLSMYFSLEEPREAVIEFENEITKYKF